MSDSKYRYFKVIADGEELCKGCRVHVTGKSTMTLTPDPWQVHLYNVKDSEIEKLKHANNLSIMTDKDSVVCAGSPMEVGIKYSGADQICFITLRDGGKAYDSWTSVSVASGSSIKSCVNAIIGNASENITSSISAPMAQTISIGTTYFGSTIEYIKKITESLNLNAYLFHDVLYIEERKKTAPTYNLKNDKKLVDVIKVHEIEGAFWVQVEVVGMKVGKRVSVDTEELQGTYRLISESIDADDAQGTWNCWVLLADEGKVAA